MLRVLAIAMLFCFLVLSQIPRVINYQGKLLDSMGAGVNDTLTMIFRLYETYDGEEPIWYEVHNDITVRNGLFSVTLGELSPLEGLPFDKEYYLEVEVNSEILSPREKLTAVPYAIRSAVSSALSSDAVIPTSIMDTVLTYGGITIEYPCGEDIEFGSAVYLPGTLAGFPYRQPIIIANTTAITTTNYQVRIKIAGSNVSFWSHRQSPVGADVRFTDTDGASILKFWCEYFDDLDSAAFWVKVPNIPAMGTKIIYLYYGNPTASSASDFDNTFTKDYGLDASNVALYHLDEGSGSNVQDGSGNLNHGTVSGSSSWASVDGGQWDGRSDVNFVNGSYLIFDSPDEYITVPSSSSLNPPSALTVEAWFNGGGNYNLKSAFADELDTPENISEQSQIVLTDGIVKIVGEGNWWNYSWLYRRPITINNSGGALSDYQVLLTFNSSSLISSGKMRSDCGDLRFTAGDGITPLSYWIESGVNTSSTKVWVKVPNVPSGNSTVYMYYGNLDASSESNGNNVFIYFDTGNQGGWTVSGTAIQDFSDGNPAPSYKIQSTLGSYMYKNIGLASNTIIEYSTKTTALGNLYFFVNSSGYRQMARVGTGNNNGWQGLVGTNNWTSWGCPSSQSAINIASNVWYNVRVTITSSIAYMSINDVSLPTGATTWSSSCPGVSAAGNISYLNNGGIIGLHGDGHGSSSYTWFDNIRIRKYASPEPTTSVGTEQDRQRSSGYFISTPITPSALGAWGTFTATDSIPTGCRIRYSIINGITGETIIDSVSDGADLSGILANSIKLKATLLSNPDSTRSPVVKSWGVSWTNLAPIAKGGAYGVGPFSGDTLGGYINGKIVVRAGWDPSRWNHIALTYNGNKIRLYLNGDKVDSASLSGGINPNTSSLTIGKSFTGAIDEVRIYNRALPDSEIISHYERRKYLPTTPSYSFESEESGESSGLRKASALSEYSASHFLGFAQSNCVAGESVPVRIYGVFSGFSGLVPGTDYYLQDTPGAIGTTTGTYSKRVGTAITTEKMLIIR